MTSASETPRVSIRELNSGASAIVNRVHDSRVTVVITNHGKEWAKIVPVDKNLTPYERLAQLGHITPRSRSTLPDAPSVRASRPSADILGELGEDRL